MKRKRAGYFWAFVDMLTAMLATYAALFILSVMQIHPAEQKPGVEMKAEYLLEMSWPDGSLDDIDLHLLLPDQTAVDFQHREVGFAVLDHDDIGVNGMYIGADGVPARLPEHKEVISLRARVPGTYVANVHVYRVNDTYGQFQSSMSLPFPAKVRLIRLNPRVEDLASVDVPLSHVGEQKTAFRFEIREDGSVAVDTEADVPFIRTLPSAFGEAPHG